MADPTEVNPQITDSVTQTNVKVLSDAPEIALATIYQNLAHSSALAMQNAVQQQQNAWTVQMAVTTKLVRQILADEPLSAMDDPLMELFDDFEDFEDEEEDF